MQVTKIIGNQGIPNKEKHQYTEEELQHEYDYIRTEQMTKKLLDKGLITVDEFNKIMKLNQQIFSPNLVDIMP
ncbi:SHOCT domain-containing protein [Clostridium tyrobutyricum]|uniref:SHOCT domain-containing protein n=1 Tax=Clostridium tyrobutyricum TaxID=1519 RepID=UPI00189CC7B2|nr:SHOCT domain-containing protein [Clostridium tyrobutyricum]